MEVTIATLLFHFSPIHLEDQLEMNYVSLPPVGSSFPELPISIMNTSTGCIFQVQRHGDDQDFSQVPPSSRLAGSTV